MKNKLSELVCKEIKQEFDNTNWQGSLDEFIELVEENPKVHMRTAFQYLNDMINYFDKDRFNDCGEDLMRYKLFDDPFNNGENAIHGNHRALKKIIYHINAMAEQGAKERILILKGPVATAKTSIIRLLMQGLEEYSKKPEGGFYGFSWIIPQEWADFNPGFKPEGHKIKEIDSYAHFDSEDVFKIPCQLNENPLMLLPRKQRQKLLNEIIKKSGKHITIPEKIKKNDLCFNCQNIYNFLLNKYEGNIEEVFKHIRVERFIISEIDRTGLATIQPSPNVDGKSQKVAWDSTKYAQIQNILPGIVLDMFEGKWADGNRGILHLTDLFQRQNQYLRPLLRASEENLVDFNGSEAYIDTVIMGTTNLAENEAFEKNIINAGLKDRIRSIDIPYVLQYSAEAKIYEKQLKIAGYLRKKTKDSKHICPHALDYLALWAITTRLLQVEGNSECYDHNFKAEAYIDEFSLVQKALLYNGELDEHFTFNEKQAFKDKNVQKKIRHEHPEEGIEGISPRQVQNLIAEIISIKEYEEEIKVHEKKCLNMFTLFKYIRKLYNQEDIDLAYDSDAEDVMIDLKGRYDLKITEEVKLSIAGIDEARVIEKIKEYVQHVNAYIQKKEIKNPITGKYEPPSEEKMEWIESDLETPLVRNTDKNAFRNWLVKEIAEAVDPESDKTGLDDEDYKTLFKDTIYESLENIMFNDRLRQMKMSKEELRKAIQRYDTPKFEKIDKKQQKEVKRIINNMIEKYDYCADCAKDTLLYSLENKLIELA